MDQQSESTERRERLNARDRSALVPPSLQEHHAMIERGAAAIANARIMRRGSPAIVNVLDILPEKLKAEVREDAEAVLTETGSLELLNACKHVEYLLEREFPGADETSARVVLRTAIAKATGKEAAHAR